MQTKLQTKQNEQEQKEQEQKVVLYSDIHLEFYVGHSSPKMIYKKYDCDTLIIAGDFGYFVNKRGKPNQKTIFHLKSLKKLYEYVLFVPGNHEYYPCKSWCLTTIQMDSIISNICVECNVIFLQKKLWIHPKTNVSFVGCTLWSDITLKALDQMNDITHVFETHKEYLDLHKDHVSWLIQNLVEMELMATTPTIVITHHLPSYVGIKDSLHIDSSGYASHLDLFFKLPVIAWCCGHTHTAGSYLIQDIPLYINPIGYKDEQNRRQARPILPIKIAFGRGKS